MHADDYVHATNTEEAERNLADVLHRHGLEHYTSTAALRDFILNDIGGDVRSANDRYFGMVLSLLSGIEEKALNEVVQAFADAWNWFPHRVLDGKSPMDIVQEATGRGEAPSFMYGFFGVHNDDEPPGSVPSPYL